MARFTPNWNDVSPPVVPVPPKVPRRPGWLRRVMPYLAVVLLVAAAAFIFWQFGWCRDCKPPSPKAVELPAILGGELSQRGLERLRELARKGGTNPHGVKVAVGQRGEGDVPVYQLGDGLKVGISAQTDCSYALINVDANGKATLFAPEGDDPSALGAGMKLVFPAGDNETVTVTEPVGAEEFLLVCADGPAKLEDILAGKDKKPLSVARSEFRIQP